MSEGDGQARSVNYQGLLIITAILALPMLSRELIWFHSLVPLPIFYYTTRLGQRQGGLLVGAALLLAGSLAMIIGQLPALFFAMTLVPVGMLLARGVINNETPNRTGLTAVIALGSFWLLAGLLYAVRYEANPYQDILQGLEQGFQHTLAYYRDKAEFPPETLKELAATVEMLRRFFAKAFPALLASSIISTVWCNMLAGHWLLKRHQPERTTWPDFKQWRLPEPMVWLVVLSGLLLVLDQQPLATIGLNLGYVLGMLYFMQGLAIASHTLARWQTPRLFRGIIYLLLMLQLYGLIMLAMIGLADTWFDLRKVAAEPQDA